jgi:hypothetical protein
VSSRSILAAAATFVVLLAGCSQQTGGSPSAGDDPTGQPGTTEQSSEEPTTESSEPSGDFADIAPCELVGDSDLAGMGLSSGQEKTVGQGTRTCEWRREGPTLNETFTVGVALFERVGLDDIVGTDTQRLPNIGSHEAARYTGTTGGCGVSLGVTSTSRVDSTATGGELEQACQLATELATLIEPKLP